MPPKKAKLTKEHLKGLVNECNIKFEGPVPPRQWPSQYSYLFHVIRDIWANRYDDYKERIDIDQKTIRKQRNRVRDLCTNASRLRTDFRTNEDTWRALIEPLVFRRFDQEIVWSVPFIFQIWFQAHSPLVFIAEMKTGNQNTWHNPPTMTKRQNWK